MKFVLFPQKISSTNDNIESVSQDYARILYNSIQYTLVYLCTLYLYSDPGQHHVPKSNIN